MTLEQNLIQFYRELDIIQDRVAGAERMAQMTSMRTSIGREHTISSDTIDAVHHEFILLIPESGNTDDLSTIDSGRPGRMIALRTNDAAYTITVKDGVDNIDLCGSDIELDCEEKVLVLIYDGNLSAWIRFGMDAGTIIETFLGLSDTPGSFSGQGAKHVRVNAGETALEFVDHTMPGVVNFGGIEILTISGGSVARTATSSFYAIESEIGVADNLDTITGGSDGDVIIIRPVSGDTITVRDNIGNIQLNSNFAMDDPADKLFLIFDASLNKWCEASDRSSNA